MTDVLAKISTAVEAGASVDDINKLVPQDKKIKTQGAKVITGDVPVGDDLSADLNNYQNRYAQASEKQYVNRYGNPVITANGNEMLAQAQIYATARMITGDDPDVMFQKATRGIPINVFRDQSAAISAAMQSYTQELQSKLLQDPANAEVHKQEVRAKAEEAVQSLQNETLGRYYDIVIQDPEIAQASEIVKRNAAADLYLQTSMAQIADAAGITDWAGAILMPDISLRTAQFLKEADPESTGVVNYFNSSKFIYEFSKKYAALDPEQKIKVIDELKVFLPTVTDNELKQLDILMAATGSYTLKELNFNQWLDKFDAITLVGGGILAAGKAIKNTARGWNATKALTSAGNKDIAGYVSDQVLREPENARKYGMTATDAAYAADPRQTAELAEILNGAPTNVATDVRNKLDAIDAYTEEAFNVVNQGLSLDDAEKLRRQEAEISTLKQVWNVENAQVVNQTENGFTLEFMLPDGRTRGKKQVTYTVDDVTGGFIDKEITTSASMLRHVVGTNVWAGADRNRLLYGYEIADFASRKIGQTIRESMNVATKGLNKKSLEKLNFVLEKGDDASVVYSYDTLVNAGIGGIKLNDKEYGAYVAYRKIMDNLHSMKNAQMRKDLIVQGVKDITIDGTVFKARPYNSYESAISAYNSLDGTTVRVVNPVLKKHNAGVAMKLDKTDLQTYYDKGYVLVRSGQSGVGDMFPSSAAGHSKWALVPAKNVSEIGPEVLRKKAGYVPRSYMDANFFVKKNTYTTIDGVAGQQAGVKTLRYFDNHDDAARYIDQLEQAAKEAGDDSFNRADYSVLGDREMTAQDLDSEVVGQWGGLYSGYRTEEPIKFGLAGSEGARMDAIEAMQNYIQHISNRYPMSQYRMGLEQRWMNHAKEIIPELSNNKYPVNFQMARGFVENSALANIGAKQKLLRAHDQIQFMNRVPTMGEQNFSGQINRIAISMSKNKAMKPLAKYVSNLAKKDAVAAARTAAFHMYLGLFNFAQFFVQGMGASIAISASPIHATKGLTKLPDFVILDNIKDLRARKIALLSKKDPELIEAYQAWQKSGMHDSALITNPDAYTIYNGMPVSGGAFSKAVEKGTFFFTAGELANLRMSFLTAFQKWKAVNKGKKLDDVGLREVIAESEKFRLHMTMANKSNFQKGVLSIPTQFLQINARYLEAMIPGMTSEWTAAERTRMVVGQMALFGAAGVPFAKYALEPVLGQLGVDLNEVTAEDAIILQRGMLGWVMNDFFDVDAVFSSRVAIGEGVTDLFADFIAGNEVSLPSLMLGPVGGVYDSVMGALDKAMVAKEGIINAEDLTKDQLLSALSLIGQSIAEVPSSSRNVLKALYYHNSGILKDKQGNIIMATADPEMRNSIAQALGFGSQDVDDFWKIVMDNRKVQSDKADAVNLIIESYTKMFMAARDNDQKKLEAYDMLLRATYSMFPDPKDHSEILTAVHERMRNGTQRVDQEVRKHLEWYGSELGSSANQINPLVLKYRQEREEGFQNQ